MNLSAPFIARPIATTLLAIGVALTGITSFILLPVASLPQMDFPTISVRAALPGASPDIMATSVATPLERQLGNIAGITQLTSTSTLGATSITVQFDLSRDINGAARDVQAAINASLGQLPTDLPSVPYYNKLNPSEASIMILTLTSDRYNKAQMYDVADSILAQKIAQVDGIGQVDVRGSSLPAVRVNLNPTVLNEYGISLDEVAQAIAATNANSPKGQLTIGNSSSEIMTNDQMLTVAEYSPLIIKYVNGAPVRLSDVGEVVESVEDVHNLGMAGNQPSIILSLNKVPGSNVITTVDAVNKMLPQLQASIPAEMNLNVILDRTVTIRAALNGIELTLILAVILVIGVVYVFLGSARAALIPSVAVPLSLLGTFSIIYLLGFSLDNLSLMAITIVTGFVVDDAIVVLENITRHVEKGMQPMQAALQGTKEVGFTVLSMSISLIAVFIPIMFMQGIVGRLLREFAYTLSIAILVSLVVSLTVTPMMCSRLLRKNPKTEDQSEKSRLLNKMKAGYARSLTWALAHSTIMLCLTVITIILTIFLYIIVPKGFFPQQDTGRIVCSIQTDQRMSFQESREKLIAYLKIAGEDPGVANSAGYVSSSSTSGNTGAMFMTLKPLNIRKVSSDAIINRLRPKLAEVSGATAYMQSPQDLVIGGRQGNAQFQYTLSGDTIQGLNEWTPKIMDKLMKIPGMADINTDQRNKALQSYVEVDRDLALQLGVSSQAIDTALYSAFGQRQVSTTYTALNQYHIVINVADQFWQDPDMLNNIYVSSSKGAPVPLGAFATFSSSPTLLAVNHQGQFPSATLSFNLLPGVAIGDAVANVDKVMKTMALPATIQGAFQGTAQAFQQSTASEPYLILAAIFTVYIVLGILYESVFHPITILSTLPSAGVGALLSLLITGTELSVIALIGVFLLIGLVKKNAIMMIDFALHIQRTENKTSREAIYEAAQLRFRPIMMTTMAALLGAVSLVVSRTIGYELREPLGITIIGGLVFSQMLTLYTTPVIYLTLEKLELKLQHHWKALRYQETENAAI